MESCEFLLTRGLIAIEKSLIQSCQQPKAFLLENLKEMVYITWIKDEESYTILVCDYVLAIQ